MKLSVPAVYEVVCDIKNGRHPRTYPIREMFDVEIEEASLTEAPEVIRGAYLPQIGERIDFSRRLHGLHLFEAIDWSLSGETATRRHQRRIDLSRRDHGLHLFETVDRGFSSEAAALRYLSKVIERHFPSRHHAEADVLDVLPAKARAIHSNTREDVEAFLLKTASELLFVDGVLHERTPAPAVSVELRGGAFLASGGLQPQGEITLGLGKGDSTERVTFLFDVAHREQASELALFARHLVPSASITENATIEIERYDVPASIHQARYAIRAALAELNVRLNSTPTIVPRFPGEVRETKLSAAIKEAARLRTLVLQEDCEPDSLLHQAKDLLDSVADVIKAKPEKFRAISGIFTLAEFAATNSPNDLSLISRDDPELANFNF